MRIACVLAVICTLALWGATAHAKDDLLDKLPKVVNPTARAHLVSGNRYYRTGEFDKALTEYKEGLQLEDAAIFLYNIGQCYRFLHRWDEASWVFRRFLDRAMPEPALVERVEGFIADAEKHKQEEAKQHATIRPPVDAASTSESTSEAPTPAGAARPTSPIKPASHLVPGERWYADSAAWALSGAGVVAMGAAGWLVHDASKLDDQANATVNQDTRVVLHDRASSRRMYGVVTGIAGLGILVGGIVKLAIHPGDHEEPIATSWRVDITANGLAVSGRF